MIGSNDASNTEADPMAVPQQTTNSSQFAHNNTSDMITLSMADLKDLIREILQEKNSLTIPSDPHITSVPTPKILHVYPELQRWLPSIAEDSRIFNKFVETPEEAEYYDVDYFPESSTSRTAPTLPSNMCYSNELKLMDQDLESLTNMALKLCRPIDYTAHTIISTSDPTTDLNSNILYSLDFIRHQVTLICTEITRIRESAVLSQNRFTHGKKKGLSQIHTKSAQTSALPFTQQNTNTTIQSQDPNSRLRYRTDPSRWWSEEEKQRIKSRLQTAATQNPALYPTTANISSGRVFVDKDGAKKKGLWGTK
ncbi:hypothetical protein BGZ76_010581 [Entomortierella beljakovae]|nr:hypothetical protein BGZ76_010581 [Entomortierella beljakovae]